MKKKCLVGVAIYRLHTFSQCVCVFGGRGACVCVHSLLCIAGDASMRMSLYVSNGIALMCICMFESHIQREMTTMIAHKLLVLLLACPKTAD
jgi:hypothetical protein